MNPDQNPYFPNTYSCAKCFQTTHLTRSCPNQTIYSFPDQPQLQKENMNPLLQQRAQRKLSNFVPLQLFKPKYASKSRHPTTQSQYQSKIKMLHPYLTNPPHFEQLDKSQLEHLADFVHKIQSLRERHEPFDPYKLDEPKTYPPKQIYDGQSQKKARSRSRSISQEKQLKFTYLTPPALQNTVKPQIFR